MHRRTPRGSAAGAAIGLASLLVVGGALAAPAASAVEPLRITEATAGASCTVSQADLTWGVKESFRSYISGSIANGEWTTENGASYTTPNFLWTSTTGSVAPDLSEGSIPFTGSVHFTGHDGALALDLADPVVEFAGDGAAYLLLQFGATDTAQEGAPELAQVRAAKIDLGGAAEVAGDTLTVTQASVVLTSEGAAAFNDDYGSYAAGDALDPLTLTATLSGCDASGIAEAIPEVTDTTTETEVEVTDVNEVESAPAVPWLPIGIGAVALIVIGVAVGMLLGGRKRGDATDKNTEASADTE